MWILFIIGLAGALLKNKDEITEDIDTMVNGIDSKYDEWFKFYGLKHSVPWLWLKAIAMNESSLGRHPSVARGLANPADVEGSKSEDGKSWGLMQVTLTTAKDFDPTATPQKLNNPEYSISIAAKYLERTSKQFVMVSTRYVEWVIKSYNQGVGNTKKELNGTSPGYAQEYWERWQRNFKKIGGV